jgi:hypothetical protein
MAAGIDTFTFADLADADRDPLESRPRKIKYFPRGEITKMMPIRLSRTARFLIGFAMGLFSFLLLLCVAVYGWSGKGTEPHIWGNYVIAFLFWPNTCQSWVIGFLCTMYNRTNNAAFAYAADVISIVSMVLSILWAPVLCGWLFCLPSARVYGGKRGGSQC